MNRSTATIASLLALICWATPLRAQEDVLYPWTSNSKYRLGVEAGAGWSLFSQSISHSPIANPTSPLVTLGSGSGLGGYLSLVAEYSFTSDLALRAVSGIEYKSYTTSGDGIVDCPGNAVGEFDTVTMSVRRTRRTLWLQEGLFLRYRVLPMLHVIGGVVYHRHTGSPTQTTRLEITSPGSCSFDGAGTRVSEETIPTPPDLVSPQRWGLEGGVFVSLPLSRSIDLELGGRFQYMLDPLSPDDQTEIDRFREKTLGDLSVVARNRMLHAIKIGATIMWRP